MNDEVRVPTEALLTTAELAAREDFTLGLAVVGPSTRTISGPGGTADVEPRVMQVLVVLAEAAGRVVTRGTLFERCWGTVYVGDDSLNRAIGAIRKFAAEIADGSFEIQTIPRTGYRLTVANVVSLGDLPDRGLASPRGSSRRQLIIGSAAAAATLTTGGAIWWSSTRDDARFRQLIDDAEDAVRQEKLDRKTVELLQQAISIHPDSAKAWGLLALVRSILIHDSGTDSKDTSRAVGEAEKTARKALALDPREPNALLAMFELQGSTLDWITRERRLREILAMVPNNIGAVIELDALLAATGLVRESWYWNERGLALEPLSSDFLGRRALKLWVFGRTPDADKVSDQLCVLYPGDPWAWFVRVQIYAFTGRARAALGMLDSGPTIAPLANVWRESLPALNDPSSGNVTRARKACIRSLQDSGMAANEAILIMSRLRQLDTAFDIANGTLLSRGPTMPHQEPGSSQAAENAGWRVNTQWMWTPPAGAMRADPRFLPLCNSIGLTDYWQERGVKPDYLRAKV